jgi:site-specific DNA-methyltransferase (adenine-specific)
MGVFLSLESPTRDMKTEAASAGFYHSPGWGTDYPKVQILTIEELLEGAEIKMPPASQTTTTFKQAEKVKSKQKETQKEIFGSA